MRFFLVLLSILPGLAWSGCNSRASFPENNANNANNANNNNQTCGNGKLDSGEECDNTPEGVMTQDGKNSCQERGYLGGELYCGGCALDTSSCFAANCDPFDPTTCADGTLSCYWNWEMGPLCQMSGTRLHPEECFTLNDCVPGQTCLRMDLTINTCYPLCDWNHSCEFGVCAFLHLNTMGICLEGGIGHCDLDDFSASCGGAGQYCTVVDPDGRTACLSNGFFNEGDPCSTGARCQAGFFCAPEGGGVCRNVCIDSGQCPANWTCNPFSGEGATHGYCKPPN